MLKLKHQKISLMLSLPFFSLFVLNLFLAIRYDLGEFYYSIIFNIIATFILCSVFLLSSFINYNLSKVFQILGLCFCALFISIVNKNPLDTSSFILLGYSSLLFWVYYKDKFNISKIILFSISMISILVMVRFFSSDILNYFIYNNINFSSYLSSPSGSLNVVFRFVFNIVSSASFLFMFISVLWLTLIDEIKYYLEKSTKFQKEFYKNESYAWYGRNVVGVVHNIKNKLTPTYLLLEELSKDENIDKELRDMCKSQISSVSGISGLLDKLMYKVKADNRENKEEINVNKVTRSIVEFFKTNTEFRSNIKVITKESGSNIIFETNPMNFGFVVENIIKNSFDNMKELDKEKTIKIEIINKDGKKSLSIKDSGTGITFLKEDEFEEDLSKCNFFKVGNTTKENGLGYGMEFIKDYLNDNKITGKIISKRNIGTEIVIYF